MSMAADERAVPDSLVGRTSGLVRRGGIVIPFAILFVLLAVASPSFLRLPNLLNILDQQAATVIVAAAGTLVLIGGGIDLSVGAVYALAGVTSATVAAQGGAAEYADLPALG